jgi:hypothetical protein
MLTTHIDFGLLLRGDNSLGFVQTFGFELSDFLR